MRTTININRDLLAKLKNTSEILNIHTNEMIVFLLNTIIAKNILDIAIFKSVKYQATDPKRKWRKLHVRLEPPIYEKGLDLRKVHKVSVSFIISYAILHFLDEITEKLLNKELEMDNYPLNYIIIPKMFDNIQGFIIIWGIPEQEHIKNIIP